MTNKSSATKEDFEPADEHRTTRIRIGETLYDDVDDDYHFYEDPIPRKRRSLAVQGEEKVGEP